MTASGTLPVRDWRAPYQSRAAFCIVLAALVFNAALCFLNTVGVAVTDATVVGAEACIVALTLAFALDGRAAPWLITAGLVTYGLLLLALRGSTDVKAVRDFLIPIAFYSLGLRTGDLRDVDRVALACAFVVVAMGVFEYAALDLYGRYFDILRYYVARGSMSAADINGLTGSLFTSGVRPDSRAILPFLGPHRVSSVFLEPVSAGNFGAILFAWALYRRDMRGRGWLFAGASLIIILADARFGAYVCVAISAAMLVAYRLPRLLWFLLPAAIGLGLAIYGFDSLDESWQNDFGGRLLWAGKLLTSLPGEAVLGLLSEKRFLSDSGYAYALAQVGLGGVLAAWALLVLMPSRDPRAWRLRCGVAAYLCLLLVISDSPFSIKTAAFLWFMLGAADACPEADASPDAAVTAVGDVGSPSREPPTGRRTEVLGAW